LPNLDFRISHSTAAFDMFIVLHARTVLTGGRWLGVVVMEGAQLVSPASWTRQPARLAGWPGLIILLRVYQSYIIYFNSQGETDNCTGPKLFRKLSTIESCVYEFANSSFKTKHSLDWAQ
jgi:hypothetical protein